MDVLEAIRQRRAVRRFKAQPVPAEMLRKLVDAAIWAPSAMNGQPWRFVLVTDEALIASIADQSRQWILDNSAAIPEIERMIPMVREPDFHIFHHAPTLLVIAAPLGVRWGMEGCTLAAGNVMLAATALGLGTCWIGMAEGWLNSSAGRAVLHLPANAHVVAPLAVGYPEGEAEPAARHRPAVTWLGPGEAPIVEAGTSPAYLSGQGLYGGLIHP